MEQILENQSQFGLQAATRLYEVGIASNRRSAYCGEYVPGPCTHRPSHQSSWMHQKSSADAEGVSGKRGEVVTR